MIGLGRSRTTELHTLAAKPKLPTGSSTGECDQNRSPLTPSGQRPNANPLRRRKTDLYQSSELLTCRRGKPFSCIAGEGGERSEPDEGEARKRHWA